MQWVQDSNQSNVHNVNNVRSEASTDFRNNKKENRKAKIDELETNTKVKNVGDLYRCINDFKKGYQPRHVARMGEERGPYRVLVGKPEGRRPLGRPRRRWVDNIRMDLQEVGCGYVDWIGLAQDRDRWRTLVSAVMNLRVP